MKKTTNWDQYLKEQLKDPEIKKGFIDATKVLNMKIRMGKIDIFKVLYLIKKGYNQNEMDGYFNVSQGMINQYIKKHGIKYIRNHWRKSKINKKELKKLVKEGKTQRQISDYFNMSASNINRQLKFNNLRAKPDYKKEIVSKLPKNKIKKLIAKGYNYHEIGKILDVSAPTIFRFIKINDLKYKPYPSKRDKI